MRKLFVLVFAVVVLCGVFAQTPGLTFGTWSFAQGSVNSPNLFAIYSEAYVEYKTNTMGVSSTLVNDLIWNGVDRKTLPAPTYTFSIQELSAWYQPFPFLKARAGKLFETGDAVLSSYVDYRKFSTYMANAEPGIMGTLYPAQELAVSAFVPFTQALSYEVLLNSAVAVRYAVPRFANFVASYRLRNYEFALGMDFRMFEALVAKVGVMYRDITTASAPVNKEGGVFFTVGRKFGTLDLGLDADITISPVSGVQAVGSGVKGMAELAIGKYVAGFSLAIFSNDLWFSRDNEWRTTFRTSGSGIIPKLYVRRDFDNGSVSAGLELQTDVLSANWLIPIRFVFYF